MPKKDAEILTSRTYSRVAEETKSAGSKTFRGEQNHHAGKGLHELVDPKGFGVIRRSLNRMEQLPNKLWRMLVGVAMLNETRFDTTGSMGDNVDRAFDALPRLYDLLKKKVLSRYDLQVITSIFGDATDNYILQRSQAEMGVKIAQQMTMMFPERDGGDPTEDPQYGIFGGAYLTSADINLYGLKYYDFTVTDALGREQVSVEGLKRVFGDSVFEKLAENGHQIKQKDLPGLSQMVKDLQKNAHAFLVLVRGGDRSDIRKFWESNYSKDRVIYLPDINLLPELQVAVIGLTEGVLSLNGLEDFLVKEAKISNEDAKMLKRAVAGIPIGAQAKLPNFNKLPKAGDLFKEKRDLYPMSEAEIEAVAETTVEESVKSKGKKKKGQWL